MIHIFVALVQMLVFLVLNLLNGMGFGLFDPNELHRLFVNDVLVRESRSLEWTRQTLRELRLRNDRELGTIIESLEIIERMTEKRMLEMSRDLQERMSQ